ncbi:MAG TPA: DUF6644 family protein [Gammaproteobacteria bacterium]
MELFVWMEGTGLAAFVRTVPWVYPAVETAHYVGLTFLVGAILLIDLRLLGFARSLPVSSMIGLLPWVWVGFVINVISGSIMFVYGATNFGTNPAFWVKMSFMVLAGANAFVFSRAAARSGSQWLDSGNVPLFVRAVATASLVLWVCVVTTGRWMAYI